MTIPLTAERTAPVQDRPTGFFTRHESLVHIALPSLLVTALFVVTVFGLVLPALERALLERKRETLRDQVRTAWSVLDDLERRAAAGEMDRPEAQRQAASIIRGLRYGPEGKDYFWICDMQQRSVVQPYRPDHEGQDLTGLVDPNGKPFIQAFVEMARTRGEGYVDYVWQWHDDPERIVPKLSYVKGFPTWGWVLGTGLYVEDVQSQIRSIRNKLVWLVGAVLTLAMGLTAYVMRRAWLADQARLRNAAQREQDQETLREQLHHTQALIDAVPNPVFFKDLNFNYLGCNTAFAEFAGLENQDIAGRNDYDIFEKRTADLLRNMDKRMLVTWKTKSGYLLTRTTDGRKTHYEVLITPLRSKAGRIMGIAGSMLDLTELKEASEELQRSETRHRTIFENSGMGMVLIGLDSRIISVNPALERMSGRSRTELEGENVTSLLCATERLFRPDWVELLATQPDDTLQAEVRMQRPDATTWWATLALTLIRSPLKRPLYAIAMVEDIEARKRAEAELAELNHRLEEEVTIRTGDLAAKAAELERANAELVKLDELKSSFVSSVSHELRTPLTSLLGFAKIIRRDFSRHFAPLATDDGKLGERCERIAADLGIIEREGARLTRLINDVLDLTKIESGRIDWRDVELDPCPILAAAVDAVRGQFDQKPDVALVLNLPSTLPPVVMDPDRLQQVLINLLNNAAKFTVTGAVTVTARQKDDFLEIAVHDTGPGVPEAFREKIFDKFHQLHEDFLTDKPQGTGLGLPICKQIVEHYGGRIRVEAEPSQGSVFIVELLIAPGQSTE